MAYANGERVFNFSAGPAAMPLPALEEAQRTLLSLPGAGASVMEISHRSKVFLGILERAKTNIRELMGVPENYKILFVPGGATQQFSAIPLNLLPEGQSADFILTGSWGKKAIKEAQKFGQTAVAWDGKDENYIRIPDHKALKLNPDAAYVHFTSNETIHGVQFNTEPDTGSVPLVCDASSDIMSRPIPVNGYGLLYAGAQKNIGPSGLALVIVREDLLGRAPADVPALLDYKLLADEDSLYNTPPTFGIYMVMLVTDWLRNDIGGVAKMHAINNQKAKLLYDVIDGSGGYYRGHAVPEARSIMNVTFRLPNEDLEGQFIKGATAQGLDGLKGHRSVGGCRASIYNAMPIDGVKALADYMGEFQRKNG